MRDIWYCWSLFSSGCGSSGPCGMYQRQASPVGRAPLELPPPPTWSKAGPPKASPPKASPPEASPPKSSLPKPGPPKSSPPSKPSKMVSRSQRPSHLDSTVTKQKIVKSTQSPRTDAHKKVSRFFLRTLLFYLFLKPYCVLFRWMIE